MVSGVRFALALLALVCFVESEPCEVLLFFAEPEPCGVLLFIVESVPCGVPTLWLGKLIQNHIRSKRVYSSTTEP